jgi:hypothetical protein
MTERKLGKRSSNSKQRWRPNEISIPYAVLARDTDADRALYNSV